MRKRKIKLATHLLAISILLSSAFGIASADVDRIVSQTERDEITAIQKAIKAKGAKWTAGATSVSDFSAEEKKRLGTAKIAPLSKDTRIVSKPATKSVPYGTFDWRNKDGQNWMTPVRSQSSCGSCWAFSAIGVVEAKINIDAGNPNFDIDLSEQQLVSSCCSAGDCSGGWPDWALKYVKNTGVPDEACFPYKRANSSCTPCSDWTDRVYKIENYVYVKSTKDDFKWALEEYGPISVVLTVPDDWFYYTGGIYSPVSTTDKSKWANHAVVLVGYNDAGGYWIIRNSWGSGWGGDGHAKVAYGDLEQYNYAYAVTKIASSQFAPTATASANVTFGKAPLTVSFTGLGTDDDGTIVSYKWNFGDGATSTSQNPSHTYTTVGTYTAILTVTDNDGLSGTDNIAILVEDAGIGGWSSPIAAIASSVYGSDNHIPEDAIDGNTSTAWMTRWLDPPSWIQFDMGYIKPITKVKVMVNSSYELPMTVDIQVSNDASSWTTVSSNFKITSTSFATISFSQTNARYVKLVETAYPRSYGMCTEFEVYVVSSENQAPTATASATPTSGTAPLAVSFTGSGTDSDGTIASYKWSFGDGANSTSQNTSHTYTTAGTYTATLTVTDDGGASGTDNVVINVSAANQSPTATASATPTSGIAPLAVSFTGLGTDSDGTIASYKWDFDDGATSTSQNPSHTYTNAGTYTAVLTVTDNDGATGTDNVVITVTSSNQSPVATASATPTSGIAPLEVIFTGLGTDSDGTIASYSWDFDDGATSTTQNPTHTYTNTGTYTAVLTVTDNDGATGTDNVIIIVTESGSGEWINPVAATASSYYSSSYLPTKAIDDNTSTRWFTERYDGPPCWIQFDLGSTKQISKVRVRIYYKDVPMTLDVQVSNDATNWETAVPDFIITEGSAFVEIPFTAQKNARYIRLYETALTRMYGQCTEFDAYVGGDGNLSPVATASATPTSGIVPLEVTFTGLGEDSDGTIASYSWDFDDGATSTSQNPTHTYTNAGTYTAVLTVTDNDGATGTDNVVITVTSENLSPVATASATPTSGTAPLTVSFTGLGTDSDGTIASYYWKYGDGAATTTQNPSHTYDAIGTYIATLTVTDNDGATGTDSVTITVTESSGTWAWTTPVAAIASSVYGSTSHIPEDAIDGNTSTSWMTRWLSPPSWIQFDMGDTKPITKVKVMVNSSYEIPMTVDIQVSDDASSWTTVSSNFDITTRYFTTISFSQTNARYVKLVETAYPRSYGMCSEFEVYAMSVTKKDVETEKEKLPTVFNLSSYPNPFVKRTTLKYQIPKESRISLTIYDMTGKIVKTLVNEKKTAGYYEANWNTKDLASGIYFAKFKTDGYQSITKLILMK